jgi:Uma2 family endonuclease
MTSAEYFNTPESVLPAELAYGALLVRDAPSVPHQSAVGSFYVTLREHVHGKALGYVWMAPLDVVLDEARALIVQPDLLFVSQERFGIVRRRIYGPPDIVLEVLSPHPRVGDLNRRLEWFETYGVRECWVYHQTEERLELIDFAVGKDEAGRRHHFEIDDEIVSACLPNFTLTLRQILDR